MARDVWVALGGLGANCGGCLCHLCAFIYACSWEFCILLLAVPQLESSSVLQFDDAIWLSSQGSALLISKSTSTSV